MQATRSAQEICSDAVMIFGGRGITKTGMGRFIEHLNRCVAGSNAESHPLTTASRTQKFDAILGGAEDVLGDLGVRQA